MQVPNTIFYNASKGEVAPNNDLEKAFGKPLRKSDIILEILKKGEQQIGQKERNANLERLHNEVLVIVAGKLVDPKSGRVYTTGMIEKALDQLSSQGGRVERATPKGDATPQKDAPVADVASQLANLTTGDVEKPKPTWTGVTTTRDAKSQALVAMKALIAHQPIPIARARMRLRITCPTSIMKQAAKAAPTDGDDKPKGTVKDRIMGWVEQVEHQDVVGDEWEVVGFVEPGDYKPLAEFIGTQTKGRARAEVLDMAVTHEGDD